MRRQHILILALALPAITPQIAAAQASPFAPDPAYAPPSMPASAPRHVRSPWYIGFGVGSGVGGLTFNGQSQSFSNYLATYQAAYSPWNFALQFEVGATVRPDLLVGFDLRTLAAQSTSGIDASVQATDYLAMLTWFPEREGFFLRGGAGFATLRLWVTDNVFGRSTDTVSGVAVLGGLGYAFWLGRRFNLTLNADISAQLFSDASDHPSSARFFDLYLGFSWY